MKHMTSLLLLFFQLIIFVRDFFRLICSDILFNLLVIQVWLDSCRIGYLGSSEAWERKLAKCAAHHISVWWQSHSCFLVYLYGNLVHCRPVFVWQFVSQITFFVWEFVYQNTVVYVTICGFRCSCLNDNLYIRDHCLCDNL